MGERRVDFIAHPRHEDEVFWISPDGVLTQLTMDERDQDRIGKRSVVDERMLGLHQRMEVIEERKKGKSPAISERQQGTLKRHDRPRQQRAAPTKHQDEYRSIQAQLDTARDTEDRTATYFEEARAANASTTDPLSVEVVQPPTAAPLALPAAPLFKPAPATSTSPIQPSRTLPPSLHKPGLPERFSSADRWEEEDE